MRRVVAWAGTLALLLVALAISPWGAAASAALGGVFSPSGAQVTTVTEQESNPALAGVALKQDWWASVPDFDRATKLDHALSTAWQGDPNEIRGFMVYLKAQADTSNDITDWNAKGEYVLRQLETVANATQPDLVRAIATEQAASNVTRYTQYTIINAIFVHGNRFAAERLAARPDVAYVEREIRYTMDDSASMSAAPAAQTSGSAPDTIELGVNYVHAPDVWAMGYHGEGVVVGSIDSGVDYTHPALNRQYRGNLGGGNYDHNYNWWDARVDAPRQNAPYDDAGHGSHTMGTVLGEDPPQTNQIGVAPGAKWIAAKVFPAGGSSGNEEITVAEDFMIAPWDLNKQNRDPSKRPNVITNSWGDSECWNTDSWLITQVWIDAGMLPIFSNGNSGPGAGTVGSPGAYPFLIGTGAVSASSNTIASFSSRGPTCYGGSIKPDIVAPGVNVRSSMPGGTYGSLQGTSMAAPHVSGVTALLLSIDHTLSYTDVQSIITRTAYFSSTWGTRPNNNYGWGAVRADSAADMVMHGAKLHGTVSGGPFTDVPRITAVRTSDNDTYSWLVRPNGTYSMTLRAGTYNFTATAFGFGTQTVNGVNILSDTTPLQNFTLAPVAMNTLSGYMLKTGACTPLSGTVTFTPPGYLYATSNPGTGAYTKQLPAGTYDLVANAGVYYQPITDTVNVGGPTQHNFTFGAAHDGGNTYYVSQPTYSWISGTTQITFNAGEDGYFELPMPFSFTYYGATKPTVWIGTNGYLTFNGITNASMWANTTIPQPGPTSHSGTNYQYPNDAIYPYWDDLTVAPRAYGSAYYSVTGDAPYRILTVEWRGVAGTGAPITFAVQLAESTNTITFLYNNISTPYGNGYSATVGIENATGSDGIQLAFNQRGMIGDGMSIRFTPGAAPPVTPCVILTPTPTNTPQITPTATATPGSCTINFADVPPSHTFYAYIMCLACDNVVNGYVCGGPGEPCNGNNDPYFRPGALITRAQIAKIVVLAANITDPVPPAQQTFEDVPIGSTFWTYIEQLAGVGAMSGYDCGGPGEPCVAPGNRPYFRQGAYATRGQLTKIVSQAAGYTDPIPAGTQTFEDVPEGSTFHEYVERLLLHNPTAMSGYTCGGPGEPCIAPQNRPYFRPANNVTRGQASKIIASIFYPSCGTR